MKERVIEIEHDMGYSLQSRTTNICVRNSWRIIKFSEFLGSLTPLQRASLEATAFGPLLSFSHPGVCQPLICELVRRWCTPKKAFKIGSKYVEFSLRDIALILGLRVKVVEEDNVSSNGERLNILKWFPGEKYITELDVEAALKKSSADHDQVEEHTRLALVYIMLTFLFSNSHSNISREYVSLVENLSRFNAMAWGAIVHEFLIKSLSRASDKLTPKGVRHRRAHRRKKESTVASSRAPTLILCGCAIALQVWAFEHIPPLRPSSDIIKFPRLLKYEAVYHGKGDPSYRKKQESHIRAALECDDVIEVLRLTDVESSVAVIKEFLDIELDETSLISTTIGDNEKGQQHQETIDIIEMEEDGLSSGNSKEYKKAWSLGGYKWVTREITEEYIELLRRRHYSLHKDQNHLKCIFLSVYFMQMLKLRLEGARSHLMEKNNVYSFRSCDMIFVPGHWDGNHWVLYVLHMKKRVIEFYNSLNTVHHCDDDIKDLANFFQENLNFSMQDWLYRRMANIPQQANGHDCGLFVLKYIECLSQGSSLSFSQSDMPGFRKKLITDIQASK